MKRTLSITLIAITCLAIFFSQAYASSSLKPKKTPAPNETPEVELETSEKAGQGVMDQHPGRKYNFKGEVKSFENGELVITGKKGGTVTVDATTEIMVSGPKDETSKATIQVGQQVMAQAVKSDGKYLALRVHIFPQKAAHVHRVGTVTEYTPGASITVQDKKGSTTFQLGANIKMLPAERANQLKVGSRVTVITSKDKTTGALTVTGIVVHPDK